MDGITDKILILDFGSQLSHLIARRVRDLGVYADVASNKISPNKIKKDPSIKGLIFSGGAMSVYDKKSPQLNKEILSLGLPILGICYGHQLIAQSLGGVVKKDVSGEYGPTKIKFKIDNKLFSGLKTTETVWMNHRDSVEKTPKGFRGIAISEHKKVTALGNERKKIYSVQFHPEVSHTRCGKKIFKNFIGICGAKRNHTTRKIAKEIIQEASEVLGGSKAIVGLSGGIDSTVATLLVSEAIGKNLTAVYVDTGLMRYKETQNVRTSFKDVNVNLKIIDAKKIFFKALKGVTDPEKKRKIIGKTFIDIFTDVSKKGKEIFLVQGTIYSDRIESGIGNNSSKIKSHHNVGGLPKKLKLKIYEPLRNLYKDEVYNIAEKIGVSDVICNRQVFPGPGLAIRIVGEVTSDKVKIIRRAGHIIESELRDTKYWKEIWMSFPVLLSIKSVGLQGDGRSYKYPIVLRIVESTDAMTANVPELPYSLLNKISNRITNEISQVNRVVYDITPKPPATMEWE